jgi:acetylornithine deacetylase/succinyl-diaminopimelate desuccinylase-like protein
MPPAGALAYAVRHRARFLDELKEFVRFPTVSAQPGHAADMHQCAAWLAAHLRRIGLSHVSVIKTRLHPIVYAQTPRDPSKPTVLIYGHYDVQPPDPLHEWRSPPFEPVVADGNLYGRGACDDKGQMFAHVKAVEAHLTGGRVPPVNVKCLFEGEEEIGSPSLAPFLSENRHTLSADVAVTSDMPMLGPNRPAITYSMRGGLSLELEVTGPNRDLHSGIFGGAVHNPLLALCEIIANLHTPDGRVSIPGFYDRVRLWDREERRYMAQAGPGDEKILKDAAASKGWGDPEYSLYERTTIRPALTVNGITGGYQGPGGKGVIPSKALAKLSFRLASDQDPKEIEDLFRTYVARVTPPTVKAQVRAAQAAKPALVSRNLPALRAAALAYRHGFGTAPSFIRSGGTIPVVNTFQEMLAVPTVLMGFALPDDRMHSPNERFRLANFYNGIATSIWFLNEIANRQAQAAVPWRERLESDALQTGRPGGETR